MLGGNEIRIPAYPARPSAQLRERPIRGLCDAVLYLSQHMARNDRPTGAEKKKKKKETFPVGRSRHSRMMHHDGQPVATTSMSKRQMLHLVAEKRPENSTTWAGGRYDAVIAQLHGLEPTQQAYGGGCVSCHHG